MNKYQADIPKFDYLILVTPFMKTRENNLALTTGSFKSCYLIVVSKVDNRNIRYQIYIRKLILLLHICQLFFLNFQLHFIAYLTNYINYYIHFIDQTFHVTPK